MNETWKPVVGIDGRYEVNEFGVVRNIRTLHVMSPFSTPFGYHRVGLYDGSSQKSYSVHRLVAFAFHGLPEAGQEVRHLDSNPKNNFVGNLRWGSKSENTLDAVARGSHPKTRLTHCPKGHEYSPENTSVNDNKRHCRTCSRARDRLYGQAKRDQAKRDRAIRDEAPS
jgi:hypothetical protein